MTKAPTTFTVINVEQLDHVTGGGWGSDILGLFGAKAAKWGPLADRVLGIFGLGGGGAPAPTAPSPGKAAPTAPTAPNPLTPPSTEQPS